VGSVIAIAGSSTIAVRPLRLLFFVPICVYPVSHGGASRIMNTIWGLSKRGHEVHVLSLVGNDLDRAAMLSLPDVASSASYVLPSEMSFPPGGLVPRAVCGTYRPSMGRRIEEMVQRYAIDIVQLEYTHSAAYLAKRVGVPMVLVEHDIAYRSAFRRALKLGDAPHIMFGLFDAMRLYRWEIKNARKADLVLAVSEQEAAILRRHGIDKVSDAVPNGVDIAALEPKSLRRETKDILFVGYFLHSPNVDALRYFVSTVWPLLQKTGRELSVSIVGSHLPTDLARSVRACGFRHAGYVENLPEELWSHRVFIAPIRYGAGTRIKLLEAAAAQCAMVSTTLGAEGLGWRDGQDLLIADRPADFARSIERLLDDSALRSRLGVSAHNSVKRRFDWPMLAANLEGLYYRLLGRS
jgi:glycosyltransferase involved in cell wall biosynthesis